MKSKLDYIECVIGIILIAFAICQCRRVGKYPELLSGVVVRKNQGGLAIPVVRAMVVERWPAQTVSPVSENWRIGSGPVLA